MNFKEKILLLLVALVVLTAIAFYFDNRLLTAITAMQAPLLNVFMIGITDIAELYLGVLIIFLIVIAARQKRLFWDMAAAMLIDIFIIIVLKIVIARPRPYLQGFSNVRSELFSSFPSGHASRAFLMFGTMAKHWHKWKWPLYAIACIIAFSRLYLGVHWPSDVVTGALLGLVISETVVHFKLGVKLEKDVKKVWYRLRSKKTKTK